LDSSLQRRPISGRV